MSSPHGFTVAFFDGIGFSELLLVAFVAILVYGGNLPQVMRNLGRAYAKFRQGLSDMSRPLREEVERATRLPPEPSSPPIPWTPPTGASADEPIPSVAYDQGAAPGGTPAPSVAPSLAPSAAWPAPTNASPGAASQERPEAGDPFDEPPPV